MLVIEWCQLPPPLQIQWLGPDGAVLAAQAAQNPASIVAVIGPRGPQGVSAVEDGDFTAVGALSALKIVSKVEGGVSVTNPALLGSVRSVAGVALTSALNGGTVTVRATGLVEDASFNFTDGLPVFLGAGAAVTQDPPSGVPASLKIGTAVSSTSFQLRIAEPILLQ